MPTAPTQTDGSHVHATQVSLAAESPVLVNIEPAHFNLFNV